MQLIRSFALALTLAWTVPGCGLGFGIDLPSNQSDDGLSPEQPNEAGDGDSSAPPMTSSGGTVSGGTGGISWTTCPGGFGGEGPEVDTLELESSGGSSHSGGSSATGAAAATGAHAGDSPTEIPWPGPDCAAK